MKLYVVSDGPPSLAVRMAIKALNIPCEEVNVDYIASEHMSDDYEKMNPQKEIPVLDDNGFYLSESIAILQYLCDKYRPESALYPNDPVKRAIVNQRLCFNMGFYYNYISQYTMAPIFFDYPRNEHGQKKVYIALKAFETYLQRNETKYVAANELTIADLPLVTSTMCLEAINFRFDDYPLIVKWYANFKAENPKLWEICAAGMKEIEEFNKNPPDLSHMNHPIHPIRKNK
ncbi:glutathione S-transferase 1-like [Bradysia coprophila]|uniref:glutathione S-transferase 1-like n=1 Tax=Bradysia coprophila TaxID=38358 RepID=UPI00187DAE1F|nr:glutathione S-transferase 1-like [Bradysia coprophila]